MGWNISNIGIVTKYHHHYPRCKYLGGPADFWAGYVPAEFVPISDSEISTRLYDCGHALIDIGNCWYGYWMQIYIDGKSIGNVTTGNTRSKVFNFAFKDGSVLKIKPNGGILRFNNFEVVDCNCEN